MAKRARDLLRRYAGTGRCVTVTRRLPHDKRLSGYVLKASPRLALLRTIRETSLDSLMILRQADITSVRSGEQERCWRSIQKSEGLLGDVTSTPPINLSSIEAAVRSISRVYGYMIIEVEDEHEPIEDFYIGEACTAGFGTIGFRHFNSLAEWNSVISKIDSREATRLQFDSPYIDHYINYMKRTGRIANGEQPARAVRVDT